MEEVSLPFLSRKLIFYMEISERHTERHHQFSDIHKQFIQLRSNNEILKLEVIEYKQKANYWETQFHSLKSREKSLQSELEEMKAQLRKREQQLFGKRSEKNMGKNDSSPTSPKPSKKNRGQQIGSTGHGRRDYSHLPVVEEEVYLSEQDSRCPCCGLSYQELPGSEHSEVLEIINVKAYRRTIRRQMYKRSCMCPNNPDPQIICPPPMERLFPKSKLGISIWAMLLLNKYQYQHPSYRTLAQLKGYGLSLSMGTVTEGFQKLLPLFIPVYDAIVERSIAAKHWHADETGWKVFEAIEDKKTNRWYLWIFHNDETVVYKIDPSRSSKVLIKHFGKEHTGGILNVDRFSAYKVIAKSGLFILAFCWAHVRRDFLEYSKVRPDNEAWGLRWVDKINHLYHINNQRTEYKTGSIEFLKHDKALKEAIANMKEEMEAEDKDPNLLPSAKKLLKSLGNHWAGLTIFVDSPEIPMDNNIAERGLRSGVVGRKNYYGSGSVWSAELATSLFSLFKTLDLWKLNVHTWLLAYLYECGLLGGNSPTDINKFLPWNMTEKQKALFMEPPKFENSS